MRAATAHLLYSLGCDGTSDEVATQQSSFRAA